MKKQIKIARQQVEAVSDQTVTAARGALLKGADLLAGTAQPVRQAVTKARDLQGYALDKAQVLVDAELETLAVLTELGAKRLKAAGEAESLDALLKGQVALMPETRLALQGEARRYLTLFFAAKSSLDAALERKVLDLVTPKAKPARKAAAPKAPVTAAA